MERRTTLENGGQTMFTIKRDELKAVMERTFDAPREAVFNPDFRCDDGTETVEMPRTS